VTYLDLAQRRKQREAQRQAAQDAAQELLRKLIGEDYRETAHRLATDHPAVVSSATVPDRASLGKLTGPTGTGRNHFRGPGPLPVAPLAMIIGLSAHPTRHFPKDNSTMTAKSIPLCSLASYGNAYAVALRLKEATGADQYVVRTGNSAQPFRVVPRAARAEETIVSMIA
jgi:hypothetical protein